MKRLLALLLTVAMLMSLAACNADDPNAGLYNAVSCTALGFSMDCNGDFLELKGNGRGTVCLMGEEYSCKWTLEGENFTLTNHGDVFSGTLHNGIITLDFSDMVYVYIMDETVDEAGNVRGHVHVWKEADCETSKYCVECNLTEGEPLGHDATVANYQDPSVCTRCAVTLAEPIQPDMEKYGITEFMELGEVYSYTTCTNSREDLATTGEVVITDYDIFTSAEGYPEKEGYEWRVIKGEVRFFDYNSRNYGYWVKYCYEDYYTIELSDDHYEYDEQTQVSTRMLSWHGEEMPYYLTEIWERLGWKYSSERGSKESTCLFTRAWQVPVGYDGIVAGFYNPLEIAWDDYHIYEVYDPAHFLLFRLN